MTTGVKLSELRSIGWTLWNPIGLSRPAEGDSTDDEYDVYLLEVASQLGRGGSSDDAVAFLMRTEVDRMGLEPSSDACARAQATVKAIASCVAPGRGPDASAGL